MKLLVFGRSGQVATELRRRLLPGFSAQFLGRDDVDLRDPGACARVVAGTGAEAVINAAAWTAVDLAETEEEAATLVNGTAPAAIAKACAEKKIPFLHISTDYVFAGDGDRLFRPEDPVAPVNAYGRSKVNGEKAVLAAGGFPLILRTSWVFSAHGTNFVKTMLRLGRDRERLRVVEDQYGGPTPASAVADALLQAAKKMIEGADGGIHHFAGTPTTTWADFAREIMAQAGLSCQIEGIATLDYPTPAERPRNSRLDCSAFTAAFDVSPPDWRVGLDEVLRELLS